MKLAHASSYISSETHALVNGGFSIGEKELVFFKEDHCPCWESPWIHESSKLQGCYSWLHCRHRLHTWANTSVRSICIDLLRLNEVLVYMQAAHGDGIIQWAASAVSAPSAMVMYEQTTLRRHLDFIWFHSVGTCIQDHLSRAFTPTLHNMFDARSSMHIMYCVSSFAYQHFDMFMGWITALVSRWSPHIPHQHGCISWPDTSKSEDVMSSLKNPNTWPRGASHMWVKFLVIQKSTVHGAGFLT